MEVGDQVAPLERRVPQKFKTQQNGHRVPNLELLYLAALQGAFRNADRDAAR